MSVKSRIVELNTRLADTLTEKGVDADASETTTALIGKVAEIQQGGGEETLALWARNVVNNGGSLSGIGGDEIVDTGDLEFLLAKDLGSLIDGASALKKIGNIYAPQATTAKHICRIAPLIEEIGVLDIPNATTHYCTFDQAYNKDAPFLKKIGGVRGNKWTNGGDMFFGCSALEEITEPLDCTSMTTATNMFQRCAKLKEVRFVAGSIKVSVQVNATTLLSAASVQSIIDGLADLTGGATQTLTLASAVAVSDEQKAAITLKNWTLVQ